MPRGRVAIVHTKKSFLQKVDRTATCWNWIACSNSTGYGLTSHKGDQQVAHRVAWQLWYGDIPDGLKVLHKCDNRACVRHHHLFLGTLKDNMVDMVLKGRMVSANKLKTHCPSGHEYTGYNIMWSNHGKYRKCRMCHNRRAHVSRKKG